MAAKSNSQEQTRPSAVYGRRHPSTAPSAILNNYAAHFARMTQYSESNHFAPSDKPLYILVDNVPDAVNPAKAKLAYVQVPGKGDSVHLSFFEVETVDDWYEAAVSATAPHRIVSVVNWASALSPSRGRLRSTTSLPLAPTILKRDHALRIRRTMMILRLLLNALRCLTLTIPCSVDNTTSTWGNIENWDGVDEFLEDNTDAGPGKSPPDGQNRRMRMYLWNTALPYRGGDCEAGIVLHELSHGHALDRFV
ncbi:hypothetical protein GGX14DRAFT_621454 [Mycena pura]|uniref:Extracellular metalloproteinase n=1 Tax=Mycena pura TaxID=153505 RepID=A0AAD6YG96_9AGAR|nr:hypothetical protein GGX14DRAFT_621454 [Mycena pura]